MKIMFVVKTKIKTDKVRSDWLKTQAINKYCTSVRYYAYMMSPDQTLEVKTRNGLRYNTVTNKISLKEVKDLVKNSENDTDVPVYSIYMDKIISRIKVVK
jgi:hypothetical protein